VIAIAGPPNAGKSSLLNRLARREAAIVSPYAGTTRDVIEVHLDLGGYPVTLLDTAGVRESDDPVEQEGVRRARARAGAADLVLWVVEGGAPSSKQVQRTAPTTSLTTEVKNEWIIQNKIDLPAERAQPENRKGNFAISALTGEGIEELVSDLAAFARTALQVAEPALVTRERHRIALQQTQAALLRALAVASSGGEELIAEELRLAARELGRLTGRVDVEDVLDVIFRDFCIGK